MQDVYVESFPLLSFVPLAKTYKQIAVEAFFDICTIEHCVNIIYSGCIFKNVQNGTLLKSRVRNTSEDFLRTHWGG